VRLNRNTADAPPIELSRETLARPLSWLLGEPDDRVELILDGLADMRSRRAEQEERDMASARAAAAVIVADRAEQARLLRERYPDGAPQPGSAWGGGGAA
jgi:hypothetical protein